MTDRERQKSALHPTMQAIFDSHFKSAEAAYLTPKDEPFVACAYCRHEVYKSEFEDGDVYIIDGETCHKDCAADYILQMGIARKSTAEDWGGELIEEGED